VIDTYIGRNIHGQISIISGSNHAIISFNMKFTTCLNCIDGRAQLPAINWIIDNYAVKYVDMITEPGMDGLLAEKPLNELSEILKKIDTSIRVQETEEIFVVAHHDCIANPVDQRTHREHVMKSVERLKELKPAMKIIGIWIDSNLAAHKITEE